MSNWLFTARQHFTLLQQDQILAILEQPTRIYQAPQGVHFCGFDIIGNGNSVLTNCGQFLERDAGFISSIETHQQLPGRLPQLWCAIIGDC